MIIETEIMRVARQMIKIKIEAEIIHTPRRGERSFPFCYLITPEDKVGIKIRDKRRVN